MIGSILMVMAATASITGKPADVLEPAFDNTIVSTYPDGRIAKLWLNRDGTFVAEGRRHDHTGGHWTIKGHSVCMRQSTPFPIPFAQYCAPIPPPTATAGWTGKAVTGEPITIRLEHGR